jgi:hypothetical protein
VRLVTLDVLAPFPARLLAARLGAEGILWQLRGESSVYPFGSVEVLVEADHVERARELAGLGPLPVERPAEAAGGVPSVDSRCGGGARRGRVRVGLARAWWWLAVLALVVGLALRVAHVG